jgi:hypothetical protein
MKKNFFEYVEWGIKNPSFYIDFNNVHLTLEKSAPKIVLHRRQIFQGFFINRPWIFIALSKFYATHRNYEHLSKSLVPIDGPGEQKLKHKENSSSVIDDICLIFYLLSHPGSGADPLHLFDTRLEHWWRGHEILLFRKPVQSV